MQASQGGDDGLTCGLIWLRGDKFARLLTSPFRLLIVGALLDSSFRPHLKAEF